MRPSPVARRCPCAVAPGGCPDFHTPPPTARRKHLPDDGCFNRRRGIPLSLGWLTGHRLWTIHFRSNSTDMMAAFGRAFDAANGQPAGNERVGRYVLAARPHPDRRGDCRLASGRQGPCRPALSAGRPERFARTVRLDRFGVRSRRGPWRGAARNDRRPAGTGAGRGLWVDPFRDGRSGRQPGRRRNCASGHPGGRGTWISADSNLHAVTDLPCRFRAPQTVGPLHSGACFCRPVRSS